MPKGSETKELRLPNDFEDTVPTSQLLIRFIALYCSRTQPPPSILPAGLAVHDDPREDEALPLAFKQIEVLYSLSHSASIWLSLM